jgi:hypothetical protein
VRRGGQGRHPPRARFSPALPPASSSPTLLLRPPTITSPPAAPPRIRRRPTTDPPPDRADMDPPPAFESRRRGGGRGVKSRAGKQLGLKRPAPAPSSRQGSPSAPLRTSPPPISASDALSPAPTPTSTPAAASSCPAAPIFNMPPQPQQGGGWGAISPNFPFGHGEQQGLNPWYHLYSVDVSTL